MITINKFFVLIESGDLFFARMREGNDFIGTAMNVHGLDTYYITTQDKIRYFYLQPGDLLSFKSPTGQIIERAVKVGANFSHDQHEFTIELRSLDGSEEMMAPLSNIAETLLKIE